jgi:hypothetical protein
MNSESIEERVIKVLRDSPEPLSPKKIVLKIYHSPSNETKPSLVNETILHMLNRGELVRAPFQKIKLP